MIDVPNIYNDPIISRKRKGGYLDPFLPIKESLTFDSHYVLLSEIPNRHDRVKVSVPNTDIEMHEVTGKDGSYILRENEFRVDYTEGIVYAHETLLNKTLDFEYTGEGVHLFPDSRIYHTKDKRFPNLRDKIEDIDRSILVERHRIDEHLLSVPQPSEVVDMRIDYNGKIFRIAKDRIDSEQRKIEEAYIDAHYKKYDSLKERIDGLQLDTESNIAEINTWIYELEQQFQVIPGEITAIVNDVREEVDGSIAYLESKLEMVPDQITVMVSEMREAIDGEIDRFESSIEVLSDRINLAVDDNGIITAINLSGEGVRIQGDKIHLNGETRIDNAVIKSAHIDDISADKVRAGTLRSQNDNTRFNLNTGELTMQNASFSLSNGANIFFNDPSNKIRYKQLDPQTGNENYAGFGVGRNINVRFPFVYMGTSLNRELQSTDEANFTGFISNTDARIEIDNAANSVVGPRFHIRDKARSYRYGWVWDLRSSTKTLLPMNSNDTGINYDIGSPSRMFRNIYTSTIQHNGEIKLRDSRSGRTSGWLMETGYASGGTAITFRGLNGGSYNYRLGSKESRNRFLRLYLRNKPDVSSDRRLKEKFEDIELGLDFVLDLKPTSFKFKETKADTSINKHEFGFIAQEVEKSMLKFNKTKEKYSMLKTDKDGIYSMEHEQLIAPVVQSIQELYHLVIKENKKLKDKILRLEKKMEGGN